MLVPRTTMPHHHDHTTTDPPGHDREPMALMALGAYAAIIGGCDLLRADRDAVSLPRQALIVLAGTGLTAGFLWWTAASWAEGFLLGLGMVVGLVLWVIASSAAMRGHARTAPSRFAPWLRAIAFAGLGSGAVVALLGAGGLEPHLAWPDQLRSTIFTRWPAEDVTVAAGAVLLQLATANVIVRLLLDAVGAPPAHEQRPDGGRWLGPMERIVIVGLGAIGEITAAAIVVAAKVLLRLPRLQAGARVGSDAGADAFLVGSFASWLIGLVGLAMIYLA